MAAENDPYFIGAYWGPREEDSRTSAERICGFLREIGDIDVRLSRWFMVGKTRKEAMSREIHADRSSILEEILDKSSTGNSLGCILSLWNGAATSEEAISLLFRCGITARGVGNSAVISFSGLKSELRYFDIIRKEISALARHFSPDWGVASSYAIAQSLPPVEAGMPRAGWITYLNNRAGSSSLPPSFRIEKVDNKGVLIIATKEVDSREVQNSAITTISNWIAKEYK